MVWFYRRLSQMKMRPHAWHLAHWRQISSPGGADDKVATPSPSAVGFKTARAGANLLSAPAQRKADYSIAFPLHRRCCRQRGCAPWCEMPITCHVVFMAMHWGWLDKVKYAPALIQCRQFVVAELTWRHWDFVWLFITYLISYCPCASSKRP